MQIQYYEMIPVTITWQENEPVDDEILKWIETDGPTFKKGAIPDSLSINNNFPQISVIGVTLMTQNCSQLQTNFLLSKTPVQI